MKFRSRKVKKIIIPLGIPFEVHSDTVHNPYFLSIRFKKVFINFLQNLPNFTLCQTKPSTQLRTKAKSKLSLRRLFLTKVVFG